MNQWNLGAKTRDQRRQAREKVRVRGNFNPWQLIGWVDGASNRKEKPKATNSLGYHLTLNLKIAVLFRILIPIGELEALSGSGVYGGGVGGWIETFSYIPLSKNGFQVASHWYVH